MLLRQTCQFTSGNLDTPYSSLLLQHQGTNCQYLEAAGGDLSGDSQDKQHLESSHTSAVCEELEKEKETVVGIVKMNNIQRVHIHRLFVKNLRRKTVSLDR